jgi:hypothetical protein
MHVTFACAAWINLIDFVVRRAVPRALNDVNAWVRGSMLPTFRSRLHETGTKSNRDHFVSVMVLFIIDVYMRLGRK